MGVGSIIVVTSVLSIRRKRTQRMRLFVSILGRIGCGRMGRGMYGRVPYTSGIDIYNVVEVVLEMLCYVMNNQENSWRNMCSVTFTLTPEAGNMQLSGRARCERVEANQRVRKIC